MNRKFYLASAVIAAVFFSAVSLTGCSAAQYPDLAAAIPPGSQADKATQMTVNVINNTTETLNLVSASHAGGVTHWQQQAPKTVAPNTTAVVTDYGSGDNSITLKYTGARTGTTYDFQANDSILDKNTGSGTTNNAATWITSDVSTGHDDHTSFTVNEGFQSTGKTETWTVPTGVHLLRVQAIGGAGGTTGEYQKPGAGADITGTLAVTPGEILTVGVGGSGNGEFNNVVAGWGMTVGTDSYAGGTGIGGVQTAGSGGGATVVLGADGNPIVIAGGGGGEGDYGFNGSSDNGGIGGENGSLTGGDGGPNNQGGKAGGNNSTQGQSQTVAGVGGGGAGGGGLAGGNCGIAGTGDGGGAGSSYDGGLTATTVTSATVNSSTYTADGFVTFTAIG